MWRSKVPDHKIEELDNRINDFKDLLDYIHELADHKLGYPVSLLSYLGIVDNSVLGIEPHSLANILLNNVGDPFKDSETSLMEVKKHERELIKILEKFYGLKENEARGYVTTGGTEGNFASLWWSKRYMINAQLEELIATDDIIKREVKEEQELSAALAKIPMNDYQKRNACLQKIIELKNSAAKNRDIVQQLLTPTVFYSKGHTHYSIPKIAEILRLNIRAVPANPDGSLDLDIFRRELMLNMGANPHSAVIVIANIGTTITGAIDNVPGIKSVIEQMPSKPLYTIHLDGALSGFVLPIIKPFGDIENYFDAIGVNTLAVSAHKYPGLSQPCGIILARRQFFEKAFAKSERSVDYVGNILDVTITGSRSGLNVLMFYNALRALGLDKGKEKLTKMVKENMDTAEYLRQELAKIFGEDKVKYPYHFNVMFPRVSLTLAKKYQLMLTGDNATICVLTNVTKALIDEFIIDLKIELNIQPTTRSITMAKTTSSTTNKTNYSVQVLAKEHMLSAAELFTKSFCDSEPLTQHLDVKYHEYEPFAMDMIQKAVQDGMSLAIVDKTKNNKVIALALVEDITHFFKPNEAKYPKMKPIFALLEQLAAPFIKDKIFTKGKIIHVSIGIVDQQYRGLGLSTDISIACGSHCAKQGYDFAYVEFTHPVSEKVATHFNFHKLVSSVDYATFKWGGIYPFKGVTGAATAYILGLVPDASDATLTKCYSNKSPKSTER